MLLLVLLKDKTMEGLVAKCNKLNLTSGYSYNYSPFLFDGKMFYTTYSLNMDGNEIVRKVSELERRNTTKK